MEEKGAQSNRPEDTPFKQQRLPAWQPLLTPKWVISSFFIIGIVFIPIGAVILSTSNNVKEVSFRYDECKNDTCTDPAKCTNCSEITVSITEDMDEPIYVYYELTNFYQNHRRYVKSRSDNQLRGVSGGIADCDPLETSGGKTLYPCGLIANSFFNDIITAQHCPGGVEPCQPMTAGNRMWVKRGIAWQSDIDNKFKGRAAKPSEEVISPLTGHNNSDIIDDEDFIVWMRTAGLPTFRKLHRKIKKDLKAGDKLRFSIENNFEVWEFDGTKSIILSTTSWLGGKNDFLGIAYIVVGCLCLVLAAGFLVKQVHSPRRLGDIQYFQWSGSSSA